MASSAFTCEHCGGMNHVRSEGAQEPRCRRCHRPLPWLVDASSDDFARFAVSAPMPVVVGLWGPWCAPSRRMIPVLEQLARALAGRAKLVRANVENTPLLIQRFTVQSLPTLLVLHRGKALARSSGAAQAHELQEWLEEALTRVENASFRQAGQSRLPGRV